jgi:dolichol-phosphate mannosyltransferase
MATAIAAFSNFVLNNEFTYRDRKLRGTGLITGGAIFLAVCAAGGVASLSLALWLNAQGVIWWAAGAAGTVIAAVWNFAVASVFTWPEKRSRF